MRTTETGGYGPSHDASGNRTDKPQGGNRRAEQPAAGCTPGAGREYPGWLTILGIDLTPRSRYRSYIARLERVIRLRNDGDNHLRDELDRARTRIGHLNRYVQGLEQTNELLNREVIRLRESRFRHRGPDGRFVRLRPGRAGEPEPPASADAESFDPTAVSGGWADNPEHARWTGASAAQTDPTV